MPTATLPEMNLKTDHLVHDDGSGFGRGGDSGSGRGGRSSAPLNNYRLGMWFGLGAILMMFVAFTSAYIYRQGLSVDWQPLRPMPVLWFNTAILLLSSITFEFARGAIRRDALMACDRWLIITTLLGIAFLVGQYVAWKQLAAMGVYLGTNPHSSFFYVLTGAHALHLLGGVLGLGYVMRGAQRHRYSAQNHVAVDVTATYWHFMDGLWVYLFMLLFLWR